MPLIVKDGDPTQGHGWPSVPLAATTNTSVKIEGKNIVVIGDTSQPGNHAGCGPGGCDKSPDHPVATLAGSPNVFVGGISVVRDADPMACGDVADTPFSTVFANGGGNQPQIQPGLTPSAFETIGYFTRSITDSYNITLAGNITRQRIGTNSFGGPIFREFWSGWRPQALTPQPSNGFRVTLVEEGSGRTFTSLQGIGAQGIPAAASPVFRQPLDEFVSYQVLQGPFTVDNSGALTLNPAFVPPRNDQNNDRFMRGIPVSVRIFFSRASAVIRKDINFEVSFNLSTSV